MQSCAICKKNKTQDSFYFDKRYGKHHKRCRPCLAKQKKEKRLADPEKAINYQRNYRNNNRDRYNKWMRNYKSQNPKTFKKIYFRYYYENGGQEKKKIYDKKNAHNRRKYERKRYVSDDNYRLKKCLRTRMIKLLNNHKNKHSLDLLGCSFDFYKKYIEYQFSSNMSWNNYGKVWNIDHVRPCDSFDLTNVNQQKECFHWTNTRPVFIELNQSKRNKRLLQTEAQQAKIVQEFLVLNPVPSIQGNLCVAQRRELGYGNNLADK